MTLLSAHAPPTGIAAARINIARTPVRAYTLHYLFALDVSLQSKLDPEKPQDERFERLAKTQVLITDEASMIDDATWLAVKDQLSTVGGAASVRSDVTSPVREDGFGRVHHII